MRRKDEGGTGEGRARNRRLTNKEPQNGEVRRKDEGGTGEGRARNRRLTNKEPQNGEVRRKDEGGTGEGRALNRRLTNKEPQNGEVRRKDEGGTGEGRALNRRLTNKEPQNGEVRRKDEGGTGEGRARNRRLTNKEPQNGEVGVLLLACPSFKCRPFCVFQLPAATICTWAFCGSLFVNLLLRVGQSTVPLFYLRQSAVPCSSICGCVFTSVLPRFILPRFVLPRFAIHASSGGQKSFPEGPPGRWSATAFRRTMGGSAQDSVTNHCRHAREESFRGIQSRPA